MASDTIIPLHNRLLTEAEEIECRLGVTRLPELLREAAKAVKPASPWRQDFEGACERACRQAVELIDAANGSPTAEQLQTIRRVLRGGIIVAEDASAANLVQQGQAAAATVAAHG